MCLCVGGFFPFEYALQVETLSSWRRWVSCEFLGLRTTGRRQIEGWALMRRVFSHPGLICTYYFSRHAGNQRACVSGLKRRGDDVRRRNPDAHAIRRLEKCLAFEPSFHKKDRYVQFEGSWAMNTDVGLMMQQAFKGKQKGTNKKISPQRVSAHRPQQEPQRHHSAVEGESSELWKCLS